MDGWNGIGRGGTSLGHINSSHTLSAYILRHACTSTMQYSYGEGLRRERDRDLILLSMDSRTDLTTACLAQTEGKHSFKFTTIDEAVQFFTTRYFVI